MPRSASRLIAAAPAAVRQSTSRIVHQQREERRLRLGAVDEREPFLGREPERREGPRVASAAAAGSGPLVPSTLAFAHERQRDVAERREVAARAHASLLRHQRARRRR